MSVPWNLEALRRYLYLAGHEGSDHLPRQVRSIDRSIQIFHFHAYAARDALKGIVSDGEAARDEHLLLLLGGESEERQEQYAIAKLSSEAHILSALHTARFMFDQFAQLANELMLNPKLTVESCDLYKVRDALPVGGVKSALDDLTGSYWFRYVQGFVNTAKHRKLIDHEFRVSFEDNVAGVKMGEFTYRQENFPGYWATEVLLGAFDVKNRIVACGRCLNESVGA